MKFLVHWISLLLIANLIACENTTEEIKQVKVMDTDGIERAKNVVLYYSDSAVVRLQLNAPTMLNYLDKENPRREFPDGIKTIFFDDSGNLSSRLTAKFAVQQERKQVVTVRDSVVIWNYRKERLECEELVVDKMKNKISSTKYVKITTPSNTIIGEGFTSNLEFTKWRILKVTGEIQSENLMNHPF